MLGRWFGWLWRPPSKSEFVNRLLASLRRRGAQEFRHDEERDCLLLGSGTYSLANAYLRYSQAPGSDRAGLIEHFATSVLETLDPPPALWDAAKARLVPLVRNAAGIDLVRFRMEPDWLPGPRLPFGDGVGSMLVTFGIDNEASVAHVGAELFQGWGQPIELVLQHAIANLSRMAQWRWEECSPGAFKLNGNEYVECLPLLPDLVRALPFGEHTIIAIPARGHVLACDGRDSGKVLELCNIVEKMLAECPWTVSEALLHHADGQWRPFEPSQAASRDAIDRLLHIGRLGDYQTQQEVLEQHLQERGQDVFVAKHTLAEFDVGGKRVPRSYCVWPENVDSLLPVADGVALVPDSAEQAGRHTFVLWRDVVEVAGDHLEPCGFFPERYRARTFPNATEFAELTRRSVEIDAPWPS